MNTGQRQEGHQQTCRGRVRELVCVYVCFCARLCISMCVSVRMCLPVFLPPMHSPVCRLFCEDSCTTTPHVPLSAHVLVAFLLMTLCVVNFAVGRNALRESEEEKERLLKRIEELKDDIDMYQAEALQALQQRLKAVPTQT